MKFNQGIADLHRKRPTYEFKDDPGGNPNSTREPETHAAVVEEIKRLGANTKEITDGLQRNLVELRKEFDKGKKDMDELTQNKISKLQEDIMTRQEALQKSVNERSDQLETLYRKLARGGSQPGMDEREEFKNALMFHTEALSVRKALPKTGVPRDKVDMDAYRQYVDTFHKHLRVDERTDLSADEKRYLSVGIDPDGGILVPPEMSARIINFVREYDPIRQLATVERIGTDTLEIMEDLDEAGAGWEHELTAIAETSTPQWKKISIPVHGMAARPRATQKLLDDANTNVEAWLARKVADKFARLEGAAFVTGDGVGKPRGFLTYSNGTTFGTIEQVTAGDSVLNASQLIALFYTLLEPYRTRATFLMNRLSVMAIMQFKDTTNRPLWLPSLQQGQPSLFLGTPVREGTTMPIVASGALPIALGDMSQAYTVVDRAGISIQRDPYTVKPFVEFYTRRRVGGDVVNFQALKLQSIP
jgi:HK97 family phage major capsid protein